MSPNNDFDIVRRSLQMSPFQTNDYSAGDVLMDPRWTTMSQCYGQQQEMFDLEKRALMHDNTGTYTAHKIKFSIMDFFSKCDHIHNILRIYSYSLRKFITKDNFFCNANPNFHITSNFNHFMHNVENGDMYFKGPSVRTPQDF